jgi:hypothetical protein
MSITIDSHTYDLPLIVVNRTASSLMKYAERVETGDLKTETIGWFYNYDVVVGQSANNVAEYAALWVAITAPVESHEITMPDESGDKTFRCYFASIKDETVKWNTVQNYFRNLSFSIIAISPARTP